MLTIVTTGGDVAVGGIVSMRLAGVPSPQGGGVRSRLGGYPSARWLGSAKRPIVEVALTEAEAAALGEALAIAAHPRQAKIYETATATTHTVALGAIVLTRAGQLYRGTIEAAL